MADATDAAATSDLASHVEESVAALAQFHADHYRKATPLQRRIDRVTETLGRPGLAIAAIALLLVAAAYSAATISAEHSALEAVDFTATLAAIGLALLILVTQRREDQLAESRAKLTLELALLTDQRTAKLIALLEELRRDHPQIANRVDVQSEEMADPVDPKLVMESIDARASDLAGRAS